MKHWKKNLKRNPVPLLPGYPFTRGGRRGRILIPAMNAAIELAQKTTVENATRCFGISQGAIKAEMTRRGIPRRRRGNLTREEADAMGPLFRL